MITYKKDDVGVLVYLEGKRVGTIRRVTGGYQYCPTGSKMRGEILPSIEAVKKTLESE